LLPKRSNLDENWKQETFKLELNRPQITFEQHLNPILLGGEEHNSFPAVLFLITFKRKIVLPWYKLTLPKNVLRIN